LLYALAQNCFVEPAGVEPASIRGITLLSTCLFRFYCREDAGNEQPTYSLASYTNYSAEAQRCSRHNFLSVLACQGVMRTLLHENKSYLINPLSGSHGVVSLAN